MQRRSARAVVLGVALALTTAVSGCSAVAPAPITVDEDTVVIDVRTPGEFASGHLDGALNIDLQSSEFRTLIADLDSDDEYVVYCRSGSRSAQAVAIMEDEGLDVEDAGGIAAAERSTGLAVVK